MIHPLVFLWGVSALHGWGVYGLNLLRHWPIAAGAPAWCGADIHIDTLAGMDPLSLRAIAQAIVNSGHMQASGEFAATRETPFDGIVLHSMGNRFASTAISGAPALAGRTVAAAVFFEDTILPNAQENAARFAMLITGSTWCEEVFRANGITNVKTVIQGIEPSIFHPAPRAGVLEGRFAVFSGGKLEFRKGQDLVVLAFRAFAERHPEAILVTAWHSPWPVIARTLIAGKAGPVAHLEDGQVDTASWIKANGIPEHQFFDLGRIPNHAMARVLNEMDVGLFPNRCEGGTNLVAMECMACGMPVIVSNNTGHKDLVNTGAPFTLTRQSSVSFPGTGTDGWGESDIEEIVETLEYAWANRDEMRRRGAAGAEAMSHWAWRTQIGRLYEALTAAG
jgi:glycosyltransferase involved in cell wall biosynthesis